MFIAAAVFIYDRRVIRAVMHTAAGVKKETGGR